mmetsp:Transcript_90392/g.292603  ORF Transcript_90392/g.292603 Transcript_90392/m.292603 type:complete len:80 (-) Transcript_90392:187-426(-)
MSLATSDRVGLEHAREAEAVTGHEGFGLGFCTCSEGIVCCSFKTPPRRVSPVLGQMEAGLQSDCVLWPLAQAPLELPSC